MNRFLELATERPVELAPFDQHMNRIIYSFSLVSFEDCEFPSNPSMSSLNWHEATKGMTEAFDVHWEQLDRHARWYLQQLMAALLHAENGLSNLGIYWVGIVVMRRIVLDIREIFALLAISLVVLWTLSAGIPSSIEGDLLTPISFTAAAWITLMLILISLSENVRILYRDLSFPWKIDF
jgi:hypothetical protein